MLLGAQCFSLQQLATVPGANSSQVNWKHQTVPVITSNFPDKIYIYIYRERERETDRQTDRQTEGYGTVTHECLNIKRCNVTEHCVVQPPLIQSNTVQDYFKSTGYLDMY